MRRTALFIIIILFAALQARAEKPLAGITGIGSNSPRTMSMSLMLKNHLSNILITVEEFSMVNSPLLESELAKFNCLEETCVLRFAADSGMQLIIRGSFDDRGDTLVLVLAAYGMDIPFQGRQVCRYSVEIPVNSGMGNREYNFISEEHAGRFLSELLRRYRYPAPVALNGGAMTVGEGERPGGTYEIYRIVPIEGIAVKRYIQVGTVTLDRGRITSMDYSGPAQGDFILLDFSRNGAFLDAYYYGRKKEIVLSRPSWDEKLFTMLFTPLGSAAMPVAAPILGYYRDSDWPGLSLWAVNAAPYLYLEIRGLVDTPEKFRHDQRDISSWDLATNRFAWYMLLAGGGGLFVDAFAHRYLTQASQYRGTVSLMGSPLVAGYLALVTGGGGHFYRGYRGWGYLYFHLDSLLMLGVLYSMSPAERYDSGTGRYVKGTVNRGMAAAFITGLGVVKTIEVIHAVLLKDNILNGKALENDLALEPLVVLREDATLAMGLRFTLRF